MKHIKLFEEFVNENKQKQIEKAAKTWWAQRKKLYDYWTAEDMDMFIEHLVDEGIVDIDDADELEEVRSDMEQYVENVLGFEFNDESE